MTYSTYTAIDFALDENFRRWVKYDSPEDEQFWADFLENHPLQQATIAEARAMVLRLRVNPEHVSAESMNRMWAVIQQEAKATQPVEDQYGKIIPFWRSAGLRWAAVLGGLVLLGSLLYRQFAEPTEIAYHTTFGKTQLVTLPDGSTVRLNGNSTLTVANNWTDGTDREVRLDGEGFFHVSKQRSATGQPIKFRVRTTDLAIEVLGTQFNVNHRHRKTEVVLTEGRVQVSTPDQPASPTVMKPGEMVSYSGESKAIQKTQVDEKLYTSWQDNLLVFQNKPVGEIITLLTDNYGLQVDCLNQDVLNRRFSGSVPTDSVAQIFTKLEKLYGITVRQDGSRYVLE